MGDMNRRGKKGEQKQKSRRGDSTALESDVQHLTIGSDSGDDEDTVVCPLCGLVYPDTSGLWIGCDAGDTRFDLKCTNVDEDCIPAFFIVFPWKYRCNVKLYHHVVFKYELFRLFSVSKGKGCLIICTCVSQHHH